MLTALKGLEPGTSQVFQACAFCERLFIPYSFADVLVVYLSHWSELCKRTARPHFTAKVGFSS